MTGHGMSTAGSGYTPYVRHRKGTWFFRALLLLLFLGVGILVGWLMPKPNGSLGPLELPSPGIAQKIKNHMSSMELRCPIESSSTGQWVLGKRPCLVCGYSCVPSNLLNEDTQERDENYLEAEQLQRADGGTQLSMQSGTCVLPNGTSSSNSTASSGCAGE